MHGAVCPQQDEESAAPQWGEPILNSPRWGSPLLKAPQWGKPLLNSLAIAFKMADDQEVVLDTLRENYDVLVENLPDADLSRLVSGLFARHCLTEYEKADISEGAKNGYARRQLLVDCLLRRGPRAFNTLCDLMEGQRVTRSLSLALKEGETAACPFAAWCMWPRSEVPRLSSQAAGSCVVCMCTCCLQLLLDLLAVGGV